MEILDFQSLVKGGKVGISSNDGGHFKRDSANLVGS